MKSLADLTKVTPFSSSDVFTLKLYAGHRSLVQLRRYKFVFSYPEEINKDNELETNEIMTSKI